MIGVVADLEAPLPGTPRIRAISVHFGLPDMAHVCDESANVERMKVHGGPCVAPLKVSWMHQVSAACAGAAHCVVGGDFNWTGATDVARAGGLTEVAIEDKRGHQGAAHLFEKGMRVLSGGPQIPSRLPGGNYPFYYEYYASQALFQGDLKAWQDWNEKRVQQLTETQLDDGSWDAGLGPAISTAFGLLSIALNYRYLPIYER